MNPSDLTSPETTSDAAWVAATLAGDRAAFGRIVERYQRLLCSIAYSATGQLSQSEDLAQEAFVEAWKQLPNLREPEKLRPWLCTILRYKVGRLRRTDSKEPVRQAESLEHALEVAAPEGPPPENTIQNEEQAILWSALARVPEVYREPLVLYYREHRSVEHVAVALDLSEDAVKQRLARGRKVLQEEVLAFVEGALTKSTPGRVFTIGVLAALPSLSHPAQAAGVGAAAAKGVALAQSTALAVLLSSVSGFVSGVITLRAHLDQTRTRRERRHVLKVTVTVFCLVLGFLGTLYALRSAAFTWWDQRLIFAWISATLVAAYAVAWPVGIVRLMRCSRQMRSEERCLHPESFQDSRDRVGSSVGEYRSRWQLFGVPLIHIRYATPDEGQKPILGWIAGGDRAYGLLIAWGGLAVAPISIGAVSFGFISVGSLGTGFLALGTVSVGVVALGGASIGIKAFAGFSATGWYSAQSGGFSLARIAAEGPVAFAEFANNPMARSLLHDPHGDRNQTIIFIFGALMSLIPVCLYASAVRRRLGKKPGA